MKRSRKGFFFAAFAIFHQMIIMAKSKESFSKREKERKRLQQKREKQQKIQQRKTENNKGGKFEDMLAYVDENGNLVPHPPDNNLKI